MRLLTFFIIFASFAISTESFAQVDQSSLLLLKKPGQQSSQNEQNTEASSFEKELYQSQKYQAKSGSFKKHSEIAKQKKIKIDKDLEKSIYPDRLIGLETTPLQPRKPSNDPTTSKNNSSNEEVETETEGSTNAEEPEYNFATDFKNILTGNAAPEVENYKTKIHPDDNRLNRIEVGIESGMISNTSKSNYYYRDYASFSPSLGVGGKFWLSPFLGISGSYTTSVGAAIDGRNNSKVSAHHEWEEIDVNFRKYFGVLRKSASLTFGFLYSQYKFSVPSDDTSRIQVQSSGLGIHVSSRIPLTRIYAQSFGLQAIPRIQNLEKNTNIAISSGSDPTSMRFSVETGGEIKFRRQSQMLWKLSYSLENNQFDGQADSPDPKTNERPHGVSVENSFVLFSIGYIWGQ